MSDRERIEKELLEFLQANCRHTSVTSTTDLLETGLLDSLLLMDLIFCIERNFQIRIESGQVTAANFRTVAAIAGVVLETAGQPKRRAA